MAEVVGLLSSVLTLATFAYKSNTKLQETIQTFHALPLQVRELLTELVALNVILQSLSKTAGIDIDVDLSALKLTLEQCTRACGDFEKELLTYASRSNEDRANFRDWVRFTYRGSGIEGFRQQLIGYKATINIALSFANLRTSTITAEGIQSCRGLIETTTIDLQAHLDDIQQKLEVLVQRTDTGPGPDAATVKRIEDERRSTERGLELCRQLAGHIDQLQLRFTTDEDHPPLSDPNPTSRMLVGEGLEGCKERTHFPDGSLQHGTFATPTSCGMFLGFLHTLSGGRGFESPAS